MGQRELQLVVGVAASAGGLEAFKVLLRALPAQSGAAFLLVQHLDPDHDSLLGELLAPCTKMPVRSAEHGVRIEPDTVYIIQPGTSLAVESGHIALSAPELHRGVRWPADHLFRSLANGYGPYAVGIVLSGAGSDGATGLAELKAAGGLTIAQTPDSCSHSGMPRSAIDRGAVDLVLDLPSVPKALERFAALPVEARRRTIGPAEEQEAPGAISDEDLARLTALMEAHCALRLSAYKATTVRRRVLRRIALAGFEGMAAYLHRLRADPGERNDLVRDLLISVTEFFRDEAVFEELRVRVVEPLVAKAPVGTTLRAWVAGCATGEEAYSMAMVLLDAVEQQDKRLSVQVFATDVSADALSVARAGRYPIAIAEQVPPDRLQRYFVPHEEHRFRVRSSLRDVVSFAEHDITQDPPFSRMDLISCRNVLIYLEPDAQRHVLHALHFALNPGRHLLLGTSESTHAQRDLFATVAKDQRIYRKVGPSRPVRMDRSRRAGEHEPDPTPPKRPRPPRARGDVAQQSVIDAIVPPTIVVDETGTVVFTHGELSPFLQIPIGDPPRLELATMLRPHLATRTRSALHKVRRGEPIASVRTGPGPDGHRVAITAREAPKAGDGAVILTFEVEPDRSDEAATGPSSPAEQSVIVDLERELQATREDLRHTVEELETSNEELRSSNEESMSMNEELQSANEELEATTEELRSLNEELTTVNFQLREKVALLEHANEDLDNFFSSTRIATLFLDTNLRIERFTPEARRRLGIDESDIGRAIETIAREPLQHGLTDDARSVLEQLGRAEREIRLDSGQWLTRTVLPYRTEARRIEGVVVTFVDITALKRASRQLELRERQQASVASLGLAALREIDLQEFLDRVVREIGEVLDVELVKILELQPGGHRLLLRAGIGWRDGLVGHTDVPAGADSQAGYTIHRRQPVIVDDMDQERRFTGPDLLLEHDVRSGVSCGISDGDRFYGVIGAHCRTPRTFDQVDADFLQSVAGVVGTAITRSQNRLGSSAELAVANALALARPGDDVLHAIAAVIGELLGALAGEVWEKVDRASLARRRLWVAHDTDRAYLEAMLDARAPRPSQDPIRATFEDGAARWTTDLGDGDFLRWPEGIELGLHTAVTVPIRSDVHVRHVLVLYSRERLMAFRALLRDLERVGRSVGSFLERQQAELSAQRHAAITRASHDAIFTCDPDGRVTEWLAGAERMYGYTESEMVGRPLLEIVPDAHVDELEEQLRRTLHGTVGEPFRSARRRKDGGVVEVSVRTAALADSSGQIVGVSCTERVAGDHDPARGAWR